MPAVERHRRPRDRAAREDGRIRRATPRSRSTCAARCSKLAAPPPRERREVTAPTFQSAARARRVQLPRNARAPEIWRQALHRGGCRAAKSLEVAQAVHFGRPQLGDACCKKLCCVGTNYVQRFAIIVTALTDTASPKNRAWPRGSFNGTLAHTRPSNFSPASRQSEAFRQATEQQEQTDRTPVVHREHNVRG